MTRRVFDWHPELNIFAENLPGRIRLTRNRDGEQMPPLLEEVGFVEIDDVADYVFNNEKEIPIDSVCVKAPWPVTWLEYSVPELKGAIADLVGKEILSRQPKNLYVGTYILSYECEDDQFTSSLKDDFAMNLLTQLDHDIDTSDVLFTKRKDMVTGGRGREMRMLSRKHECHSIQIACIYTIDRNEWFKIGYDIFYLDEHGCSIKDAAVDVVNREDEEAMSIASAPLSIALGLLNCKNVKTKLVKTSKTQTKKLRKSGSPIISRRTLVIHPTGTRYEGGRTGTGNKQRQHMCRGHFKTFTPAAPLFGKIVGTYWWQSQFRGSKHLGEVHKDYRVERE